MENEDKERRKEEKVGKSSLSTFEDFLSESCILWLNVTWFKNTVVATILHLFFWTGIVNLKTSSSWKKDMFTIYNIFNMTLVIKWM